MPRDGAHVWRPRRADYPVPYGAGLVAVSRCERTRAETTDIPTATATPVQGRGQVGRAPVGGLTRGSVASRNLCFGGRSGLGVSEGVRSAYDPTGNVRLDCFFCHIEWANLRACRGHHLRGRRAAMLRLILALAAVLIVAASLASRLSEVRAAGNKT